MLEMKESAMICKQADKRSLVLIDELGRATSNEDGVAIAWAVSECLLRKGSITFMVSHYPQLSRLGMMYPQVRNQHMDATVTDNAQGEIYYTHKVSPGPCTVSSDYGVELANCCGWPSDVLQEAKNSEQQLRGTMVETHLCAELGSQDRNGERIFSSLSSASHLIEKILGKLHLLSRREPKLSISDARDKLQVSLWIFIM